MYLHYSKYNLLLLSDLVNVRFLCFCAQKICEMHTVAIPTVLSPELE